MLEAFDILFKDLKKLHHGDHIQANGNYSIGYKNTRYVEVAFRLS